MSFFFPNQHFPAPVWGVYIVALRNLKLDFPGSPVVKILCFQCRGTWVPSMVGGLRSLIPCDMTTTWTFVGKVMSLFSNTLSRFLS